MFKLARFWTVAGLGLASFSFLGLLARHLPPVGVGLWILFLLSIVTLLLSYFAGPLLDQHFGWEQDTSLGLAIGFFAVLILGGVIGWLIS